MVKGDFLIFSPKRSFLLRKRMMEVSMKNLLLQMESKSMRDSCMRFCSPRWEGRQQDRQERENMETGKEKRRIRLERGTGLLSSSQGPCAPDSSERQADRQNLQSADITVCLIQTSEHLCISAPTVVGPVVSLHWELTMAVWVRQRTEAPRVFPLQSLQP